MRIKELLEEAAHAIETPGDFTQEELTNLANDLLFCAETPPQWNYDNPHPEFIIEDWQYEVQNRDTILGYNEWVVHKHESIITE